MQFVILFGQGHFLSRHVHQVILEIIDRAMREFSATGMDPDRYQFFVGSYQFHPFCAKKFLLSTTLGRSYAALRCKARTHSNLETETDVLA